MNYGIELRPCKNSGGANCRGCDIEIKKGELLVYTYSSRNRGQSIMFCIPCARSIGGLVKGVDMVSKKKKIVTFDRVYIDAGLDNIETDVFESLEDDYNPIMEKIPRVTKGGYCEGVFRVKITWSPE